MKKMVMELRWGSSDKRRMMIDAPGVVMGGARQGGKIWKGGERLERVCRCVGFKLRNELEFK